MIEQSRVPDPGDFSGLIEVLTGPLADRYGVIPKIPLPADDERIRECAIETAKIVSKNGLFRRGSAVLCVIQESGKTAQRLSLLDADGFRTWVEEFIAYYRVRHGRNGELYEVIKSLPKEVAQAILKSPVFWPKLPDIARCNGVRLPVFRSDKIELLQPGYDSQTRILTLPDSEIGEYEMMTLSEGITYIRELLEDFPFVDQTEERQADNDGGAAHKQSRSLAVQVTAMLSQFAGSLLDPKASRMGFLYNANSPRSGKSLLAKLVIEPLHGPAKPQSWVSNEEEIKKTIDSEMLAGTSYILFDNVRGFIASQALEGLMTFPSWTGRILGKPDKFEADNQMSLFITSPR